MKEKKATNQKFITFGIPDDEKLLSALGIVTIRHGHLDHILRMTVRTIAGLAIAEALDATSRQGTAELRKRVGKLARNKFGEGEALLKLQALLTRAQRVTEKRNALIHSLWGHELDGDGTPVVRKNDRIWETAPSVDDLNGLSNEIAILTSELNLARLEGFIFKALFERVTMN
jgi:hypothetical protein